MATMPRNMVTLGAKCLPNDLHLEPKWSKFEVKSRLKTNLKAKMQNITKHNYLLCFVKVSHLKKHTFFDIWGPKSHIK